MADEKYKYFDVREQSAGSSTPPVPGLAYRATVLGTTGANTLRIDTQWGIFDAELNYNAPAASAKEAIVMQRNGRWIVLGVYR
jgi:hypothetical protein